MLAAGEVRQLPWAQFLRHGKLRARTQPLRKVIACRMVRGTLRIHFTKLGFQSLQVARARYFCSIWHPEHEVAEPNLLDEEPAKIRQQCWRTLPQELIALHYRAFLKFSTARLQHD